MTSAQCVAERCVVETRHRTLKFSSTGVYSALYIKSAQEVTLCKQKNIGLVCVVCQLGDQIFTSKVVLAPESGGWIVNIPTGPGECLARWCWRGGAY